MGQTATAKPSPTTATTLTAITETGKDGKLKYLLRQDLFVPPSLSKPNCRHQNIGPSPHCAGYSAILQILNFSEVFLLKEQLIPAPQMDTARPSPYEKIQTMVYQILELLQSPQAPSPKLTHQVHSELTPHLATWASQCLSGGTNGNKDFYSMDTQQLSTVEFVVASQVNCPFPCFLYLDDKASGNRSTAAPSPAPRGTLSL